MASDLPRQIQRDSFKGGCVRLRRTLFVAPHLQCGAPCRIPLEMPYRSSLRQRIAAETQKADAKFLGDSLILELAFDTTPTSFSPTSLARTDNLMVDVCVIMGICRNDTGA